MDSLVTEATVADPFLVTTHMLVVEVMDTVDLTMQMVEMLLTELVPAVVEVVVIMEQLEMVQTV